MANLPVREMVLYKHGVGFFVRQGQLEGHSAVLTFRADEINDVLKSLAVFDQGGGQVLGIHYDTPMDRQHRLKSSSINLSQTGTLHDLISDLRGRQVTMVFETTPGTLQEITGRVIGLDNPMVEQQKPVARMNDVPVTILILAENGQTYVFPLDALRTFTIHDAQSEHDLSYFLDTSMTEDDRRPVSIRLSDGAHDLVVYYVAPSPTWRVSYRLVAESDDTGSKGKALLQGWGLFDNRLDEDLNDVKVTLVAGQPISFVYDLYTSKIPQRPVVEDENRVAPGPVEYEAQMDYMLGDVGEEESSRMSSKRLRRSAPASRSGAVFSAAAPEMDMEAAAASVKPGSEGKATGETFQYIVTSPVTVKRGESALVPIIGSEVQYERELLYNRAKLPDYPVAAIRFTNSSGLTLERGPVTVVEDGDYRGEAVLPFTKENNEVYLPYAVELGVRVRQAPKHYTETFGLKISESYIRLEQYRFRQITYILENTTADEKIITVEAPLDKDYELVDTPAPTAETLHHRRWQVTVAARRQSEFVRKERQRTYTHVKIEELKYHHLDKYLKEGWLSDALYGELSDMLDALAEATKIKGQIQILRAEREELYKKQEEIRKNLGALQATGKEADLRNRILSQLEETQNSLDAIDAEIKASETTIETLEAKAEDIIKALGETTK